jgi:hypothetical protein
MIIGVILYDKYQNLYLKLGLGQEIFEVDEVATDGIIRK